MINVAIPELDRKELREFGLVTGAIFAVLFGLFFPWLFEASIPLWPWLLAGILILWALLAPETLRPVYRVWMKFGLQISRITTPIILGLVFYLVFFPVGVVMRLVRHDPMTRSLDSTVSTYRVKSRKAAKQNFERPF